MEKYEILEYNFNGSTYVAYYYNNNIVFGIKNGSTIDTNLNKKENFIIRSIYNFIVGDKKYLLELEPININDKSIKVLYNEKNKLYSFYQIVNDKISYLDNETLKFLNCLYNNQNNYMNKNGINNLKDKFKILVKIGGVLTTVLVSSAIILSSFPIVPNNEVVFKMDYYVDSLYKNKTMAKNNSDYSYNEIIETINNNTNLTDSEKNFLINGLKNEILENIDYMDLEQIKRNLSELNIKYFPVLKNYDEKTKTFDQIINSYFISAQYTFMGKDRNLIEMFGYISPEDYKNLDNHKIIGNLSNDSYICSKFENCDKSDLIHEVNHLLNKRKFLLSINGDLGDSLEKIYLNLGLSTNNLEEMINELFAREYLEDFSNQKGNGGYEWLMPITYALCEILDENTIRTYKYDSDNFYITDYLENIGIDKNNIHNFYKCLDLVFATLGKANAPHPTSQDKKDFKDNNDQIYKAIKYFYETKYNSPMENDLIMMAYFYNTIYVDEEFNESFRNILGIDNIESIEPKGYVSKNYKEKHPGVIIKTKDNTIVLTDENRYINYTSKKL